MLCNLVFLKMVQLLLFITIYYINLCFILQRVEVERTLTDTQRDEFEDMLRALTLERTQIKAAMGFALDNADAAGEVMPPCTFDLIS
jgi:hypothetical protein